MANRFIVGIVGLIGFSVLFPAGNAAAQASGGGGPATAPLPMATSFVLGDGTPGTVPIWTGPATLGDSHILDGTTVTVNVPLHVSGTVTIDGNGGYAATAVAGDGATGTGLTGLGFSIGVYGGSHDTGVTGDGGNSGVHGISTIGVGVRGESWNNDAVQGLSTKGRGVYGSTDSAANNAVVGQVRSTNPNGAVGVLGDCPATQGYCNGVIGQTNTGGSGVVGILNAPAAGSGIHGYALATSGSANGIVGETSSPDAAGVIGLNNSAGGQGVRGGSSSVGGIGVFGYNTAGGVAGQFQGDLNVTGNAYKPGGGSWSMLSDARVKKSIRPLNGALQQFLQLRGVTYEYSNPSAFGELTGTHIGMVAQDVEQVFPSWVDTGNDGYKRLTFRGFEAVAVEAVRELDANAKDANARITDLERQNAELRHAIESLSEIVKTLHQR